MVACVSFGRTTLVTVAVAASCVLLLLTSSEAATRAECKPSACEAEITLCRSACPSTPKRKKRSCRRKCKRTVTKACRSDEQTCGGGGGGGGGQCQTYTSTDACPARSLLPLRDRNPVCIGPSGDAQPCDVDFDTKFRVRTPWRTHAGACCVIDTCRGATSFGIYDNLALPPVIPPGQSPLLAPVTVTVQALSSYFQKPPLAGGARGQWGHHTATILSLSCSTPPRDRVISIAGGPVTAVDRGDFLSYDTRPVPPPSGSWDFLGFSADETAVSFTPPQPPLLPPCGSTVDTTKCQPHVFDLQNLNFTGSLNPIVDILSERISLDKLCDDAVFASAEGTFRRQDGSQCSVTIYAQAKIGCDSNDDCLAPEVCTTTDPLSPTDFGNAFPGWAGRSCVIPPL